MKCHRDRETLTTKDSIPEHRSRFWTFGPRVTIVINPAAGCHYFSAGRSGCLPNLTFARATNLVATSGASRGRDRRGFVASKSVVGRRRSGWRRLTVVVPAAFDVCPGSSSDGRLRGSRAAAAARGGVRAATETSSNEID